MKKSLILLFICSAGYYVCLTIGQVRERLTEVRKNECLKDAIEMASDPTVSAQRLKQLSNYCDTIGTKKSLF